MKQKDTSVKWYSYPTSVNSWIDAKALVRYEDKSRAGRRIIRKMTGEEIALSDTIVEEKEDATDAGSDDDVASRWNLFDTESAKVEIVLMCQDIVNNMSNLTAGHGDSNMWMAQLSSPSGHLLPNPT